MPNHLLMWRYFEQSKRAETECWEWAGKRDRKGYARTGYGLAHRFVYERYVGPIPPGHEVDHLCRNRACVNPKHLEAVDHRTNTLRSENFIGVNARKTHCARGHVLEGEHLGYQLKGGKRSRYCVTCSRDAKRRYKARKRAERAA